VSLPLAVKLANIDRAVRVLNVRHSSTIGDKSDNIKVGEKAEIDTRFAIREPVPTTGFP
jgi:hypothetical protein